MQNLLWVIGAVVFSTVVICLIWLRNRKPTSMEAGIKEFSRELRALAPDSRSTPGRQAQGRVDRAG
jgi:hypothetical protein